MDSLQNSIQLLASSVASLNSTVTALNSTVTTMDSKLDKVISDISNIKSRMSIVEEDSKQAFEEIFKLKDQLNTIEQRNRALVVRIFGLPPSDDEKNGPDAAKAVAKIAYDRIFKPLLAHAKEKGAISTVPQISNVIHEAFRINPRTPNNRPSPILVKLSTPAIKTTLFKAKKDAFPQPTAEEKSNNIKRFHLAEDLTPANFSFLKSLREHDKVERAWSTNGEIRYTLKGDKDSYVHKAKSSFCNINHMLS
jgi:uncharacterized phage infection (PIP) family protein YhgE